MPEELSIPNVAAPRGVVALVLVAGTIGLLVVATLALWVHYGTAVFFEMVRTGFAACFG